MTKKNNGIDFLFSDNCGFINGDNEGGESHRYSDGSGYYHGADGSDGYIYSDGSGYYHGADGSDGYIYSDGSAYFHGADGTDAYKYSDGSGYYHGADGSDGYKYSDGSGYYTDALGSRTSYDADNGDCVSGYSSSGGSFAEGVGSAIGSILGACAAVAMAEERARKVQKEIERKERQARNKAWRKEHRKSIAIFVLFSVVLVFLLLGYYEVKRMTPIGFSNLYLSGLEYTEAVQELKDAGFTNVNLKEISDLPLDRDSEENLVTEVNLLFLDSFDENTKYPSNLPITIVYHTVKLYKPPITSKDAKGMNYLDVMQKFETSGFINVSTVVEYDIVTGWLIDDGEVKSITINGNGKYDYYDEYRLDADVIVTYHSLMKNKGK